VAPASQGRAGEPPQHTEPLRPVSARSGVRFNLIEATHGLAMPNYVHLASPLLAMSHLVAVKVKITDLEALAAACVNLGAALVRGVTTYNWFGQTMGDYPLPAGYTTADLGKCTHVIRIPGVHYEVGVVAKANGQFDLLFDFWGRPGSSRHDGHRLKDEFGEGLCRLVQHYNVERTARLCTQRGHQVSRVTQPNGTISLYAQ